MPLARPALALWHRLRGLFFINSYVKGRYLTHDRHVVFRENVAVFAPLVAFVRYVPLKGKIFFHLDLSVPSANSIAPAGAGYTFRNPAETRPGKQGS